VEIKAGKFRVAKAKERRGEKGEEKEVRREEAKGERNEKE